MWDTEAHDMHVAKTKPSRGSRKTTKSALSRKARSLRDLKAFGLWADRDEVKDPVEFTKDLRTRMDSSNAVSKSVSDGNQPS
jgi:hypothetical protein